ncbi:monocarboxylate transporter 2-like [Carassius gibelio]|uniref:monocarboxylate transporter 2-like n=1 Tax=Carassius gibelio TaxID=101364 RepID=UPI0022794831|nr:monocarboxylate transporter 2-like [Carassius gibelio]
MEMFVSQLKCPGVSDTQMPPPVGPPAVPPPDGGWGWAVVGGAFISIGFSYAFPKATTVFFKDIQRIFHASYSEVAWISSIMLAVMYAGGPISSILVNTCGCRPVMVLGGFLCAIGMISASFCNSVTQLYICIGVIGGQCDDQHMQPHSLTSCNRGKLVDITKNYKYMYLCCGSVVVLSSIWLFIGNFINYRLLERERKHMQEEMYKRADREEQERDQTETDTDVTQELCENKDGVMQHETNI